MTNTNLENELWQTAVNLRGTVAPADYKHYVLPLLFMRYLSLRYEQRYTHLTLMLKDTRSEYYTGDPDIDREFLEDAAEYESHNVFVAPPEARWNYVRRHAQADDIKIKLDRAMSLLEEAQPKLRGLLPPIYAQSNLNPDQVAGLINLFSKDIFSKPDGSDILGRTYMYFISTFASTEGNRGGEFFTPYAIVRLLVEMLEPKRGKVNEDLQLRLLLKLLNDELDQGRKRNLGRYRSFKEMLDEALTRYNNRIIEAKDMVEVIRKIHAQQQADAQRQAELNLTDEELAFYDVIVLGDGINLHQTDEWIAGLVRQVVAAVRANLQVDWTKPHRSDIEAAVRSAVGRVLRRNKIKGEQFIFLRNRLMKQARASYEDWPMAA